MSTWVRPGATRWFTTLYTASIGQGFFPFVEDGAPGLLLWGDGWIPIREYGEYILPQVETAFIVDDFLVGGRLDENAREVPIVWPSGHFAALTDVSPDGRVAVGRNNEYGYWSLYSTVDWSPFARFELALGLIPQRAWSMSMGEEGTVHLLLGALANFDDGGLYGFPVPIPATVTMDDADFRWITSPDYPSSHVWEMVQADFDGDGRTDVAAGVPWNGAGQVSVVLAPEAVDRTLTDDPTLVGDVVNDHVGQAVAAGDLDGDGDVDLALGAPLAVERAGVGYVWTDVLSSATAGDLPHRFDASRELDFYAYDVSVGDLDHDGHDDLALSAPRDLYYGLDQVGRVELFLGPLATGVREGGSADLTVIASDHEPDLFGFAVEILDLTGDGWDDLLATAPADSQDVYWGGSMYLFSGADDLAPLL